MSVMCTDKEGKTVDVSQEISMNFKTIIKAQLIITQSKTSTANQNVQPSDTYNKLT